MDAYVKAEKIGKANDEKDGEEAEKVRPIIENTKQGPFQFVSVWFWCSRCFYIPYIFTKRETWSLLQANLRGENGGTFVVGPGWHLASLRNWL